MKNVLTFEILLIISRNIWTLIAFLKMEFAKFHENRLTICGEINEKHALQINSVLGYSELNSTYPSNFKLLEVVDRGSETHPNRKLKSNSPELQRLK